MRSTRPQLLRLATIAAMTFPFVGSPLSAQVSPPETVKIDRPNVTQHMTDYPHVRFRFGDVVDVSAGGCVQTGGGGRTWKRYVNPSGKDADRYYHGLIVVPGAIAESRIEDVIGKELVVRTDPDPARAFLQLGYEDDDYGNNGYYSHDDGTDDQCKGMVDAYAIITIRHPVPKGGDVAKVIAPETPKASPTVRADTTVVAANKAPVSTVDPKGFLQTLPGIITAIAGLITAIAGLAAVFWKSRKDSPAQHP
jgi:hypothetical protein